MVSAHWSRFDRCSPDVAMLDIGLPELDGCAVARTIREERLPVELVFLTVCDEIEVFEQALEWDVKGYLLKDATAGRDRAVRPGRRRGTELRQPVDGDVSRATHAAHRTRSSRAVPELQRLTGAGARDPAAHRAAHGQQGDRCRMGISPKTVDAHRANICQKLILHGNHVLSRFAWQHRDAI